MDIFKNMGSFSAVLGTFGTSIFAFISHADAIGTVTALTGCCFVVSQIYEMFWKALHKREEVLEARIRNKILTRQLTALENGRTELGTGTTSKDIQPND